MAAAQMKIKSYQMAISSLDVVIRCQPDNVKALYRKGKVRIMWVYLRGKSLSRPEKGTLNFNFLICYFNKIRIHGVLIIFYSTISRTFFELVW